MGLEPRRMKLWGLGALGRWDLRLAAFRVHPHLRTVLAVTPSSSSWPPLPARSIQPSTSSTSLRRQHNHHHPSHQQQQQHRDLRYEVITILLFLVPPFLRLPHDHHGQCYCHHPGRRFSLNPKPRPESRSEKPKNPKPSAVSIQTLYKPNLLARAHLKPFYIDHKSITLQPCLNLVPLERSSRPKPGFGRRERK